MAKNKTIKVNPRIHQKLLKVVTLRNRVSEEIRKIGGSNVTVFEWEPEDIIEQALRELIISWKIYYPELVSEVMEND